MRWPVAICAVAVLFVRQDGLQSAFPPGIAKRIIGLDGVIERKVMSDESVSYTHLDVYKRQVYDKP